MPRRYIFPAGVYARMAKGQATPRPAVNLMKSRRRMELLQARQCKHYHIRTLMSASGQKQTCAAQTRMSAKGQEQTSRNLFDHLVGARKYGQRNGKPEHLRGFEVDDNLVLSRRLHRQVGGFFALQDAIDVAGGTPELID